MEILKDCPFCGPRSQVTCQQDEYGYWAVVCGCCGGSSGIRSGRDPRGREKVIEHWNTRPEEARLEAERSRVLRQLAGKEHA